jgi:hypothetical protein
MAVSAPRYLELREIKRLIYPLQTPKPQIHEIIQQHGLKRDQWITLTIEPWVMCFIDL